jgi:hypothetical protein
MYEKRGHSTGGKQMGHTPRNRAGGSGAGRHNCAGTGDENVCRCHKICVELIGHSIDRASLGVKQCFCGVNDRLYVHAKIPLQYVTLSVEKSIIAPAIDGAGLIYKHCIVLHRKYNARTGKSLNKFILMKHLTQRKKLDRYPH